ncbi:protein containing Bacterial transglutaminase-like protein [Candidatus Thiomargarita nelsonii]|uniref:Protein containing Bacterial transglutaminase-like protein n=1 Tax=Candidatus Thiomargarita nelsonii TaxID=1003181 RepID=A0A176S375_9GAMM|nr:protein containing Bacterial transglutaminase-like protein [Candidatus Thiomargarita nelsonii]
MKYRITHKTVYTYSDTVSVCHNQAYLMPRNSVRRNNNLFFSVLDGYLAENVPVQHIIIISKSMNYPYKSPKVGTGLMALTLNV